ncbi:IS701 family transposase [Streptomyces sp. P17]|uniref:IS701 family transposase n=1 Tax=Streptomyces sp. P17 TaxID=3074716 RepID=UPI0028F42807|nr:IS701 family transposase [Streptomyces sp. P17]MDT9701896.1 IS701 family transposase [Streptomyces sp. P17]
MTPLFYRPESQEHALQYLRGLLSPLQRKNGWTIAEFAGEKEPKALQRFLNLTPWSADLMRDLVRDYAMERFADPRGVLIADPTGFAKKGSKSAGVQRQYSGTLGRVDNCQIGTFLAYANRRGDRVLIDRELYLPKDSWAVDFERRREAGIPDEVAFRTRPQQVQAMIDRAVAAGVPFSWFVADEEFGQNRILRRYLEAEGIAYCMAVPKSTDVNTAGITTNPDTPTRLDNLASHLRPRDFSRRACGIGAKGFRTYDWAVITGRDGRQYVVRRSIADGELAYFHCYNPRGESLSELVAVIGLRWPVEECFEAAKQQAGLDNYQVRKYDAWYRHITLSMLALAFLAAMARTPQKGALRTRAVTAGRERGGSRP